MNEWARQVTEWVAQSFDPAARLGARAAPFSSATSAAAMPPALAAAAPSVNPLMDPQSMVMIVLTALLTLLFLISEVLGMSNRVAPNSVTSALMRTGSQLNLPALLSRTFSRRKPTAVVPGPVLRGMTMEEENAALATIVRPTVHAAGLPPRYVPTVADNVSQTASISTATAETSNGSLGATGLPIFRISLSDPDSSPSLSP